MNQFLKKGFFLFTLVSCVNAFAQNDVLGEKEEKTFNPKFTLGSGFYTLTNDIAEENNGLGRAGFNAGMKFDISDNLDFSLLFIKASFSGGTADRSFSSDVDGIGLHLGYVVDKLFKESKITPLLSFGVQKFNVRNNGENSSAITIPLGLGLRMNVTERLQFDFALNFGMGLGDIDMYKENSDDQGDPDGYKSLNVTIHYDLFTADSKEDNYFDDSYYADVNFQALDVEDSDSDLVPDIDDYCPKTPIGVKVDETGCPLDGDNDGIPDYIDEEKNTQKGVVVDEKGVQLTEGKYHSMYSKNESASRKYANFYNEHEIKRENYKTIDEYLIAKANAFNKAYNEGKEYNKTVEALKYKVKIGAYSDDIPATIINKYLSLDDLESFSQDNGEVFYVVGTYSSLEDAFGREYELESQGFNETSIVVDNNGIISDYIPPAPEPVIVPDEVVEKVINNEVVEVEKVINDEVEGKTTANNATVYRIQIGAFKVPLSQEVFKGVDNVISFTGKDGFIRYMTGSFSEYKDAVNYMNQMRARGFEDAFVVTYKDGERISLNTAIKIDKKVPITKETVAENEEITETVNIEFVVQILVASGTSLSAKDLKRMAKLGNIEKEAEGSEILRYFIGSYTSLEAANVRLLEAKELGYKDTFVFAKLDGKRISLEQAKELLK